MKKIPLSKQGKNKGKYSAIVDDADFVLLSSFRWCFDGRYVQRRHHGKRIRMHVFLMSPDGGNYIDHVNGNPLDNRRCNLRICNQSQNSANARLRVGGASQYKGVWRDKRSDRWCAQIGKDYGKFHLGSYRSEVQAARAYDQKAKELFGDFARLNFPDA